MTDAVQALVEHSLNFRYTQLDATQERQALMIILDTVAVGIAGSQAMLADSLHGAAPAWGGGGDCRVLGRGAGMPAPTAALLNGYQIHGQEYDCVHEPAVVHCMAAIVAAALAELERASAGSDQTGVSGTELLNALAAAADVAVTVGLSARTGLRFFRPATAGAFGAAAVVSRLRGFDANTTTQVFGHLYSQLCGTMQAHTEGAAVLPVQIGFNARNALFSADLAGAGVGAPVDILNGPYGYFELFEPGGQIDQLLPMLGKVSRIHELSYKPFPTGRATHGGLDGILRLREAHGFEAADVESVTLSGPPLIQRLVARPIRRGLKANYARLCMQYVGAVALEKGSVGLFDFDDQSLNDPQRHALAAKIEVLDDGNPDPNALGPQTIEIRTRDGSQLRCDLSDVFGSPERPMTAEQHESKIRHCCDFAGLSEDVTDQLIAQGLNLSGLSDAGEWLQYAWRPQV